MVDEIPIYKRGNRSREGFRDGSRAGTLSRGRCARAVSTSCLRLETRVRLPIPESTPGCPRTGAYLDLRLWACALLSVLYTGADVQSQMQVCRVWRKQLLNSPSVGLLNLISPCVVLQSPAFTLGSRRTKLSGVLTTSNPCLSACGVLSSLLDKKGLT